MKCTCKTNSLSCFFLQDNNNNNRCETINEILQRSNFAKNHVKRRTNGHIINGPKLPKIRANIKYAGNDSCEPDNYCVPFNKIKSICNAEQKLELYRRKGPCCTDDCGPIAPPLHPQDVRNCCLQVDPQEIKDTLKGINADTRKKGIEVSCVYNWNVGYLYSCRKFLINWK